MRTPFLCLAAALFSAAGLTPLAFAQDTLAQESSHRQAILARLPADAAKRVFGLATSPAPGPARPIGDYTKGCVAGAVQLPAERDNMSATDLVNSNGSNIDPRIWRPEHRRLLEAFARSPEVERIFVNPAIKRALCREAGADRAWLERIRPWWGHNYHFHVRLACPRGEPECRNQAPPPPGDGCGADLD